jgi:transposase
VCFEKILCFFFFFAEKIMANTRAAIVELFQTEKTQAEIVQLLGVHKGTVSKTIKRYQELGTLADRPRSGRPRTARTPEAIRLVQQRVRRNPRRKMRKIARETGINREAVRRIAKYDLKLRPFKLRKGQYLNETMKANRLAKCRALLSRSVPNFFNNILFTDEKFFTIEQSYNSQNDRVWSTDAPDPSSIVMHKQHPKSVMVWGGICATGKTPLIFVEEGTKVNQEVYLRDVLQAVVLPWSRAHFRNRRWTFQQDSAPAHRATNVQQWCKSNFPGFISAREWPPYSPDLNPMDYSVWSILEARACAKPHRTVAALKASLVREWEKISVDEVRKIVENFQTRLEACIQADGGHFEKY